MTRIHRHNTWIMSAVLAVTLLYQPAARAELEEIIVTARKREEPLQKTPVSITAFTVEQLEQPGLDDLTDVSRFAPNVIFDRGTGNTGGNFNSQVFIRGVGQVDFLFTTDPGVGIYVDEVYLPRVVGSILDMVDIERLEILRGPQGTLFGKNTIGGALNITSVKPGNEFDLAGEVTFGSRDRLDGKVSVDLPMTDDLSARLTASSRNQDGYVDRVNQPGVATGDINSDGVRGQLQWTPGDWNVLLEADWNRRREEAIAHELIDVQGGALGPVLDLWNALVAPTYGPGSVYDDRFLSPEFESQATGPSLSDLDMWGVSANIARDLGDDYSIKSITAYREEEAQFGMDQDHSPYRYLETDNDNNHDAFSQEFQLNGSSFGDRLDWVAGLFYMHEKASDDYNIVLGGGLFDALEGLPVLIGPAGPIGLCPSPEDAANLPVPGPLGCVGNPNNVTLDFEATIYDDIEIDSYAAYLQGTYQLTDKLSTTVGVRYTDEDKTFTTMLTRNASGVTTVPETTVDDSWDAFTPRVGFEYQWQDNLMTYISASRGFKSGGFNGRSQTLVEIESFDPEYLWAYEIGVKSQWADNTVMLNLAAFYNDYTDIQLTSVHAVEGIIVAVTENAGKARIQGLELELAAQPVEAILIRAGLGYTDAEYTELDPGATVTLDSKLAKVPEWTGNLVADWTLYTGDRWSLTFGGDLSYRSSVFSDPNNTPILEQDSYSLLGAHARIASADERWQVTVFGTNLADERYLTNGLQAYGSFGTADGTYGPPSEWGVTLRARF